VTTLAWVSHRDYEGVGGAESADREMIARRPDGVEVTWVGPGGADETLHDFDVVVLTGMYSFTPRELATISKCKPFFWVHDTQFSGNWMYLDAKTVICLTLGHIDYEMEKNPLLPRNRVVMNPGGMDVSEPYSKDKLPRALWAHRPEYHKGLDLAAEWVEEHGVELDVLVGRPRTEVLEAMSTHQFFILLSHIYDPGPRSVMEAQLSGCNLVTNDMVGIIEDIDLLKDLLSSADKKFWELVLS
jgi:hypothetical protein